MACNGSAASRTALAGAKYANGEFIQVHPTAIPGADKLRLMSESARGEGGRVWVPRKPQDPRDPNTIPEAERYYFLEERYPKYGNLVPRDIATREIFNVCVNEGLSVERDRQCVYLDLTHIPREELDRKLGGILHIYEKFSGEDPRKHPMKIFPAVHYSMGGLWATTNARPTAAWWPARFATIRPTSPACMPSASATTNITVPTAWAPTRSCPASSPVCSSRRASKTCSARSKTSAADERFDRLFETARATKQEEHNKLLARAGGHENPYVIHQELGDVMTKAATVVRHNDQLRDAIEKVGELAERVEHCSLSDTGQWTNQNVVFTKALRDMFPLAKAILKGALARDECRGAHYKPEFEMPGIEADDPAEHRRQAEKWCDEFEEKNRKWLKTTIATMRTHGRLEAGRAQAVVRRSRHDAHPAPAAALRPGRRRSNRRGLESSAEEMRPNV